VTQNIRYALRTLAKQPAFAAIIIITFALGIGANTAVFSVLNAVLLRPLPFKEPEKIVALAPYDMRVGADNVNDKSTCSYPDFLDWREENRVFERVAVYTHQSLTLTDGKEATHIQGGLVSADLFPLLGVQPLLGRVFLPNEDEPGSRVVVLSHGLWQRRFGGDPTIIGKSLTLAVAFDVRGAPKRDFRSAHVNFSSAECSLERGQQYPAGKRPHDARHDRRLNRAPQICDAAARNLRWSRGVARDHWALRSNVVFGFAAHA